MLLTSVDASIAAQLYLLTRTCMLLSGVDAGIAAQLYVAYQDASPVQMQVAESSETGLTWHVPGWASSAASP